VSLVDSCPSTLTRSNERLTVTPSSRSQVSGDSAASLCTKHSSVAKPGEIIPAPLAWAVSRTEPPDSETSRHARLANASVVRIASAKSASPSGASERAAPAMPRITACIGSGTPITPVEATATWASETPATIAPAPCILAALSRPGRPVAAFALPEFTTTARRSSIWLRWVVSRTGAASVPELVKRAALTVRSARQTSSPRSRAPLGLIPDATPAARNPCGSPAAWSSVTCSGRSIQREQKNRSVSFKRSPLPRAGRTSG
jgi:hypothetical protein